MSAIDKVEDVLFLVKKYLLPTVFLIAGIYLLYLGSVPQKIELNNGQVLEVEQDKNFLYAALIIILVSVIWFLYILHLIKSMIGYGIMAIMLIGAITVLYIDYQTVQREVEFNREYAERELEIQVRILDIKAAQLAYKEVNGTFTNNFDDLIVFVENGKKMDFKKYGALPERKITPEERDFIYGDNRPIDRLMTEEEAAVLARRNNDMLDGEEFIRDTIFVPVMQSIFNSERYLESRSKLGDDLIPFHPDSMRYVPYSDQMVQIDTASIMKGEIRVPTLYISMTHPMEDPIDGYIEYSVGALEDNHLRESWD